MSTIKATLVFDYEKLFKIVADLITDVDTLTDKGVKVVMECLIEEVIKRNDIYQVYKIEFNV